MYLVILPPPPAPPISTAPSLPTQLGILFLLYLFLFYVYWSFACIYVCVRVMDSLEW